MALGAGLLAGCSTTRLDSGIAPLSELGAETGAAETSQLAASQTTASQSGEYGIVLPEEVAVLPSSYAGPTPGGSAATDTDLQLAGLPPKPEFPNDSPARDVFPEAPEARVPDEPSGDIEWAEPGTPRGDVDRLMAKYAALYEVPEALVRRVVKRESNFNPKARNGA